jgi:hypothetical protein
MVLAPWQPTRTYNAIAYVTIALFGYKGSRAALSAQPALIEVSCEDPIGVTTDLHQTSNIDFSFLFLTFQTWFEY